MKKLLLKECFKGGMLALALVLPVAAFARPAKPGPIEVRQPDGTTLTILLEGDERNHRAFTTDGYLIIQNEDGYYFFADRIADGVPVASSMKAVDPQLRTPLTVASLASIDKEALAEASRKAAASRKIATRGPGLYSSLFPTKGKQKGIAILLEFPNMPFTVEDPYDYYFRMLNEEGFSDYGSTGSAKDYYVINSGGQFVPEFDVFGPVMAPENYEYYGKNNAWGDDIRIGQMIRDACQLVDEEADFSQYDCNGDGIIDNVYVFYAGYGEADGGPSDTVWPHSWDMSEAIPIQTYYFDGFQLEHYACSNELQYPSSYSAHKGEDYPDGIGSFVHEFSHVMGLPDYYSTNGGRSFTPGTWNIMDVGSYNNESRTPPNFSAQERYALDWLTPELLYEPGEYQLENLGDSNKAYLIRTGKENEYFLLENRQQTGFDKYLPGHGMLVWHIDFVQDIWDSNEVNNTPTHQYIDLVEADNVQTSNSRSADSFPGSKKITSLTCETTPAFLAWDGSRLAVDLFDITEKDGVISFRAEECEKDAGISFTTLSAGLIIEGRTIRMKEGTAKVYDIAGRSVAVAGEHPVELPSGIYFINNGKTSHKFILK